MWSGPRNISTALMRSWGNRPNTVVIDEPFYAFYLATTGKEHPGASEVIAEGETDWRKVVSHLTAPIPEGAKIAFHKHMAHHLLPEIDRGWLEKVTNCFLIRDPEEVIVSYIKKGGEPVLEDLGFVQQVEIFDWVRNHLGSAPVVVDAEDVLENPERMLRLLCQRIGVPFEPAMLSWPSGLRETDGVWAKYWYSEVARSTSFQPRQAGPKSVPERFTEIHKRCLECYNYLHEHSLR
jgi:sulfotransferase family protein